VNTRNESWKLHALVDDELDLASRLELEERLRDDPALRRQVEDIRAVRELVSTNATRHAAPAALRDRIAQIARQQEAAAPARPAARPRAGAVVCDAAATLQRWFGWQPLAASLGFAAVLAVAVNLVWLQSSEQDRVQEEVVASHVRSTLGQHLVDMASSDHHTVKPFLSSRLGFSPPVPDALPLPGSVFVGGRVDYLDGRPVAALVYRQGQHVVNSFVWPAKDSDSAPRFAAERGFQTAHWSANGMNHWVISDVNREEFQAFVRAVQVAEGTR